jgi:hypothetical protein
MSNSLCWFLGDFIKTGTKTSKCYLIDTAIDKIIVSVWYDLNRHESPTGKDDVEYEIQYFGAYFHENNIHGMFDRRGFQNCLKLVLGDVPVPPLPIEFTTICLNKEQAEQIKLTFNMPLVLKPTDEIETDQITTNEMSVIQEGLNNESLKDVSAHIESKNETNQEILNQKSAKDDNTCEPTIQEIAERVLTLKDVDNTLEPIIDDIAKQVLETLNYYVSCQLHEITAQYLPNENFDWLFDGDTVKNTVSDKYPTIHELFKCLETCLKERYTGKPSALILLPSCVRISYETATALYVEYLGFTSHILDKIKLCEFNEFKKNIFFGMCLNIISEDQIRAKFDFVFLDFFTLEDKKNPLVPNSYEIVQ